MATRRKPAAVTAAPSGLAVLFAPPTTKAEIAPIMPPLPQAKVTPLSPAAVLLLAQAWNPFSHAEHEARMNYALMSEIAAENDALLVIYVNKWNDWATNAPRYKAAGQPVPPPPAQPVLQDIAPMPDGYWYGVKGF